MANVSLKDIAEHLGVTKMTVSAALRGTGRIGEETRRQVIKAAMELGYRPNTAARSIRSGRFNCLSLLLSFSSSQGYLPPTMLSGIRTALDRHGLYLVLSQLPDEKLVDETYVPTILRHAVSDGLLIKYDVLIPPRMMELLHRSMIPSIWINSKHAADCIYADEIDAGRQATEHLLALGHRRIAYVAYSGGTHYSVTDRYEGYRQAMGRAGLEPRWVDRSSVGLPRKERAAAIQRWLERSDHPTAVLVTSDTTMNILLLTAARMGLEIPRDLSIVAFGDAQVDALGIPTTSQIMPNSQVGEDAVEMLLKKIDDPSKDLPPRAIPGHLQSGGTSAPPSVSNEIRSPRAKRRQ